MNLTSIRLMETLDSAAKDSAKGKHMLQASCSKLKYCTKANEISALITPPNRTKVTIVANRMNRSVNTVSAVENPFIIDVRMMNFTSNL